MNRFAVLAAANHLLQFGIVAMSPRDNPRWRGWYAICAVNPLAQPCVWIISRWPRWHTLWMPITVATVVIGPVLWPGLVGILLRRFVA